MEQSSVKKRLEEYLAFKRISKTEFGKAIGVSSSYVSAIRKSIDIEKVKKIEEVYPDLNIDWLLYGTGKMIKGPYERMNRILQLEGITQREFEKGTGDFAIFIPGMYKNAQNNPGDPKILSQWVDYLLERFPQYSRDWILFGKPPMIMEDDSNNRIENSSEEIARIPVFDLTATAGLVAIFHEHRIEPTDYLSIPGISNVDGAVFVRGDSMDPLIKSGDIVIFKKVELSEDSIIWGQIYLLSYTYNLDDYTVVKYVKKSDRAGYIKLVSENSFYDPQEIPASSVRALAIIKASITFHTIA